MALASAVILQSEYDTLSESRLPQPGGPGTRIYISHRNRVARLHPQAPRSFFVASYGSQRYCGGIRTRLHTVSLHSLLQTVLLITHRHKQHRKHPASNSKSAVGLERAPLSLVSITEELLEWKSSGSGSRKSRFTAVGIRCIDHATPSIRKSWHQLRRHAAVVRWVQFARGLKPRS
jgi:hypothetical protein